jgi:hypothetical protein
MQSFSKFEVRQSSTLIADPHLERKLYDAKGRYRGELSGPGKAGIKAWVDWSDYGKDKHVLLDAYRPEVLSTSGDWVLVMDAKAASMNAH